jgi:hypothetical protein
MSITNILALPLANLAMSTGTNEDWLDAVEYVYDDGSGNLPNLWPQLDIRGIMFWLQVRPFDVAPEVDIEGTTQDGTMLIGTYPDIGFLVFNVGEPRMRVLVPGSYVADVVATADGFTRRTLVIDLTVTQGITREPFLMSPWRQEVVLAPPNLTSLQARAPLRIAASPQQARIAKAIAK